MIAPERVWVYLREDGSIASVTADSVQAAAYAVVVGSITPVEYVPRGEGHYEWRASGADQGGREPNIGNWRSTLELAKADEGRIATFAYPPYDDTWIDTRWVSQPVKVETT